MNENPKPLKNKEKIARDEYKINDINISRFETFLVKLIIKFDRTTLIPESFSKLCLNKKVHILQKGKKLWKIEKIACEAYNT